MNSTPNIINIAIDGWSACGKGTIAKSLAQKLDYIFIDSGAMYRAFTLAAIREEIQPEDAEKVRKLISQTRIDFRKNSEGVFDIYLNGENVSLQIRDKIINENVSKFSALSPVRKFLVAQQQLIAQNKGVVMDGRDIGTVVLPNAELKIFMTASPEIRAQRRFDELKATRPDVTFEEIAENLKQRDFIDSTRDDSPLKQADDAILLDNSNLSREEQLQIALNWVDNKIESVNI
jgi:cytidylate kinase